jgi:hypothetical protein
MIEMLERDQNGFYVLVDKSRGVDNQFVACFRSRKVARRQVLLLNTYAKNRSK